MSRYKGPTLLQLRIRPWVWNLVFSTSERFCVSIRNLRSLNMRLKLPESKWMLSTSLQSFRLSTSNKTSSLTGDLSAIDSGFNHSLMIRWLLHQIWVKCAHSIINHPVKMEEIFSSTKLYNSISAGLCSIVPTRKDPHTHKLPNERTTTQCCGVQINSGSKKKQLNQKLLLYRTGQVPPWKLSRR